MCSKSNPLVVFTVDLMSTYEGEHTKKECSYACALIVKPSRLLAKCKLMSFAKAFYLDKGNITLYLTSA
jgi:hypothetical protein